MLKPRTFVLLAAAGTAGYMLWRWQWQRIIAFDKSLFTNPENNKHLAPGFTVQPEKAAGKGRPIPTTVHRGAPPDGTPPRRVRTSVHKGEPPKSSTSVEPHFSDSASQHIAEQGDPKHNAAES